MHSAFVQSQLDAYAERAPRLPLSSLTDARRASMAAFGEQGLPGPRGESWKYTSLKALDKRSFAVGDTLAATRPVDPATFALPGIDGARLVFVNGAYRADLSDSTRVDSVGVELHSLGAITDAARESVASHLIQDFSVAAFAQLNTGLASEGAVIRVAAGTRCAHPLHLVFVGAPAEHDVAWYLRNIVVLGEDAEISIIEHHMGSGEHAHLGNVVNQIAVGIRAKLQWSRFQWEGTGVSLIMRTEIDLDAGAEYAGRTLELGCGLSRHDVRASLRGNGASFTSRGAFAVRGRQHVDTQLAVDHLGTSGRSEVVWRGVADERARGVFGGAIVVRAGADGSDARLSNKNLLLSPHAEIDTKPVLEIHADEVKAAHGATVGQLDERALFYLRSRGVPLEQARSMLTFAFCAEALQGMPEGALRDYLVRQLMTRLPHEATESAVES